MKNNTIVKIWPVIKRNSALRILSLLNIAFVAFIVILLSVYVSFSQKTEAHEEEIKKNEQTLLSLQKLALVSDEDAKIDIDLFENKSFANYEDVVPFIAFMENLFADVDPEGEITIKSREEQIFIDHFADYDLKLKIGDKKAFFSALDKLHESRFITKLMSFTMYYKETGDGASKNPVNELSEAEVSIRLYLK